MQESKEHFRYKVSAHILSLHLNKNINFETKITWKRNVNKVQTDPVIHQNCVSTFNQTLQLELNLVYNHQQSKFETKLTEFAVVVIYQGKVKSGGNVRYDAAQIVNQNYNNEHVKLTLNQCPDPEAHIEVIFNYEVKGQTSRSLFNELSMLDPSGIEKDLSQIDFRQEENEEPSLQNNHKEMASSEKENQEQLPLRQKELSKIHNILDKFQSFSRRIATNQKSVCAEDHNTTKSSNMELSSIPTQQEQKLRARVIELENELQIKNAIIEDFQKKLQDANRQNQELQLKLELSAQKIVELEEKLDANRLEKTIAQEEQKYKRLYQQTLEQLEQYRQNADHNLSNQNQNLHKLLEDVHKIDQIPEFETDRSPRGNHHADELERQNIELQTKVASISHNIAQLFNAAHQYGGPKLLDYLQHSIGLIQS